MAKGWTLAGLSALAGIFFVLPAQATAAGGPSVETASGSAGAATLLPAEAARRLDLTSSAAGRQAPIRGLIFSGTVRKDVASVSINKSRKRFTFRANRRIKDNSKLCRKLSSRKISCNAKNVAYVGFAGGAGSDKITIARRVRQVGIVDAGSGRDKVRGGGGANAIVGGAGNDSLKGSGNVDVLVGQAGRDTLSGGRGNDYLVGGAGRDKLRPGPGQDQVQQ